MTKLQAEKVTKANQIVIDTLYEKVGTDNNGFDVMGISLPINTKHVYTNHQLQYSIIEYMPNNPNHSNYVVVQDEPTKEA